MLCANSTETGAVTGCASQYAFWNGSKNNVYLRPGGQVTVPEFWIHVFNTCAFNVTTTTIDRLKMTEIFDPWLAYSQFDSIS